MISLKERTKGYSKPLSILLLFILWVGQATLVKAVEPSDTAMVTIGDPRNRVTIQLLDSSSWSRILIGRSDVGTLPTSPFYFLKEWGREIERFFTFDPVKRAELELRYVDEKLLETAKVAQECSQEGCDERALEIALSNYLKSQERLVQIIQSLERNPDKERLLERAFQRVIQHTALFDELIQNIETLNQLSDAAYKTVNLMANTIVKDINISNGRERLDLTKVNLPYPSQDANQLKTLEIVTRISDELPEDEKVVLQSAITQMAQVVVQRVQVSGIKEIVERIQPVRVSEASLDEIPSSPSSEAWYSIENIPFKREALKKVLIQMVEPASLANTQSLSEPEEVKRIIEKRLEPITVTPSLQPTKEPKARVEEPKAVCPEIAPACGNSKEECLKAAKLLEENHPGCQYTNICETGCDYKTTSKEWQGEACKERLKDCGLPPKAAGNWICRDNAWRLDLLLNSGFEEIILDKDKTFDPANWHVVEGKTEVITRDGIRYGTDRVIEEWPELIQVVNEENGIKPYEGQKMVKIDARIYLKTNLRQYYPEPIEEGRLVQEIYLYPQSKEYLQQIEIRGKRDEGIGGKRDEEGVRGNQLFALKYSHEKMLLVVTTGKEWREGRHIIWKEFEPLPANQWSLIKIILEKAEPTNDEHGRTISQWSLSLYLNEKLLYQSGREDEPYIQYFQSADFVVIGDDFVLPEDKPADKNKMGPTTGDSFGIVYYDAIYAYI